MASWDGGRRHTVANGVGQTHVNRGSSPPTRTLILAALGAQSGPAPQPAGHVCLHSVHTDTQTHKQEKECQQTERDAPKHSHSPGQRRHSISGLFRIESQQFMRCFF